mmetsp:Transcript_2304/g.4688  ORF Transcript_2304/g.4688 Transcript_2304/m.4688 type:complete len:233 (-) Transcript_2304:289-987(-)
MITGLSDYELERERLIARNRERLQELGIPGAASRLKPAVSSSISRSNNHKPAKPKPKRKAIADPLDNPTRRSTRLRAQSEPNSEIAGADELGQLIVDGLCPRCGLEMRASGSNLEKCTQHLALCTGLKEVYRPPISNSKTHRSWEERIAELELNGIVEFTDELATFVVVGSTGKHYQVSLSAENQTCQCIDHRIRRHACKHIRLILEKIGLDVTTADQWHSAVDSHFKKMLT